MLHVLKFKHTGYTYQIIDELSWVIKNVLDVNIDNWNATV